MNFLRKHSLRSDSHSCSNVSLYRLSRRSTAPSRYANTPALPSASFVILPLEILDNIADTACTLLMLHYDLSQNATLPHPFSPESPIIALTRVSSRFRCISLRRYFAHVVFLDNKKWWSFHRFMTEEKALSGCGYMWIRHLQITPKVLEKAFQFGCLSFLTNLSHLSFNLLDTGLHNIQPVWKSICSRFHQAESSSNPGPQPSRNIGGITGSIRRRITHLTLLFIPRIDVHVLKLVVGTFPSLTDLTLSSTERINFQHCIGCYEESLQLNVHSPIPEMFCDARELACAFADTLKPLTNLTNLYLGIYLSDEGVLFDHLDHIPFSSPFVSPSPSPSPVSSPRSSPSSAFPSSSSTIASSSSSLSGKTMPHEIELPWISTYLPSTCSFCCSSSPLDPESESELPIYTRREELQASLIFAQKLKALRTITWSSLFSYAREEDWEKVGEGYAYPNSSSNPQHDGYQWDTSEEYNEGNQEKSEPREIDIDVDLHNCMKAKVWITRGSGRVKVQRRPPSVDPTVNPFSAPVS